MIVWQVVCELASIKAARVLVTGSDEERSRTIECILEAKRFMRDPEPDECTIECEGG